MSHAEATSRKGEFLADQAKMDALMKGDVTVTHEWQAIVAGLSARPATMTGPRDDLAAHLQECSGHTLSPEVLQEIRDNPPITPDERHQTLALWEDRQRDPQWRARLNRGELKAKQEMALIQFMLSRSVRDPQVQS
jgi:hypothetical protein